MEAFKVVLLTANGVIQREASFSHLRDAQDVADVWQQMHDGEVRVLCKNTGVILALYEAA